jgi:hypothetical protein
MPSTRTNGVLIDFGFRTFILPPVWVVFRLVQNLYQLPKHQNKSGHLLTSHKSLGRFTSSSLTRKSYVNANECTLRTAWYPKIGPSAETHYFNGEPVKSPFFIIQSGYRLGIVLMDTAGLVLWQKSRSPFDLREVRTLGVSHSKVYFFSIPK